jgi:hypothetical protein
MSPLLVGTGTLEHSYQWRGQRTVPAKYDCHVYMQGYNNQYIFKWYFGSTLIAAPAAVSN